MHVSKENRTHDPSNQAAKSYALRPRGHRYQQVLITAELILIDRLGPYWYCIKVKMKSMLFNCNVDSV
jgi:hypothetical protein